MNRTKLLMYATLATGLCTIAGCGRPHETLTKGEPATNTSPQVSLNQETKRMVPSNYPMDKAEALAYAQKRYEEELLHPELVTNRPPSRWPFPNYRSGPHNPPPVHVNFYRMSDRYPTYLLCQYDVKEENYDRANEQKWFKAALKQIRGSGPKQFPPLKWIAVMIVDRSQFKDSSTWEKCCKVGAIFKASDVFDSSRDPLQLVAQAEMDRHPFLFDQQQPSPGEQQRWIIVEHHAATNHIVTDSHSP